MIRAPIFTQGSRIRVRRGRFPMDARLLGRTGIVVEIDEHRPGRLGVVLDDEDAVREFAEDELETVAAAGSPEERADTGPTVGP